MAIFHNLHCYLSGTSHHNLSPGLLQELSDLPVHLYTQQSMCHTTAKFFFLILSRIMSFFSKYSKVFHLILSKKQNSYNGLYNPRQIISQTYALHSLSCFYSIPGTCHMCSRFMAFALPALSKLLPHGLFTHLFQISAPKWFSQWNLLIAQSKATTSWIPFSTFFPTIFLTVCFAYCLLPLSTRTQIPRKQVFYFVLFTTKLPTSSTVCVIWHAR